MKFIENERIIIEGTKGNEKLTLTTHRIRKTDKENVQSIMLEELNGGEIILVKKTKWIIRALTTFIITITIYFISKNIGFRFFDEIFWIGFLITIVCMFCYFFEKRYVLSLSSGPVTIKTTIHRKALKQALEFLDEAENAKSKLKRKGESGKN